MANFAGMTSSHPSSRTDRLFLLLENGTNFLVRKIAAQQLGEIVKSDHDLANDFFKRVCFLSWHVHFSVFSLVVTT